MVTLRDDYAQYAQMEADDTLDSVEHEQAIKPLMVTLWDADKDVRREAATALGRIADKEAVLPLMEALLEEENGRVRQAMILALDGIRKHRLASQ